MGTDGPLSHFQEGNVTVVLFNEDLKQIDEVNVAAVRQQLLEIMEVLPHPLLVLDLGPVEFFGSSFIEVLFRVWKKISQKPQARLGLAGLQSYCREVLSVTHLDSLWQLFDTHENASEAFNALASNR